MPVVINQPFQEIFDTVCAHLDRQGHQARNQSSTGVGICCYRTKSGDKCAVGCLIPDEEYVERIEGLSLLYLKRNGDILVSKKTMEFLIRLQSCHDTADSWKSIKNFLYDVAYSYRLSTVLLDTLPFDPH